MIGLVGCQGPTQGPSTSLPGSFDASSANTVRVSSLQPPYTLAVLPLENFSGDARLHWLGSSLSEMLVNDLAQWPGLSVVAREALGPILREQWIQHQGFSSESSSVNLGQIQSVRYLVRGGFHSDKDTLTVDLQIIDVETGIIVSAISGQGHQVDLPQIEHDLVIQLGNLFRPPLETTEPASVAHWERKSQEAGGSSAKDLRIDTHDKSVKVFGSDSVHQIDLQLSLERLTQQRTHIYKGAEAFWREGWDVEIGRPLYHVWESREFSRPSLPFLVLSIAVFMKQNKVSGVLEDRNVGDLSRMIQLEIDGFSRSGADEAGTSRLFFGYVREPRRFFVRALNEEGELLAVYSKWSWKTASLLKAPSSGRITFPMWPEPFIRGEAEFPLPWVERGKQHVTFDVAVAPIPHEQLQVVLEPIRLSESEEQQHDGELIKDEAMLLPLKNMIEMKWEPPITETLPVEGYLPANKHNISAILKIEAGKIADVLLLDTPPGTLFSRSLEALKSDLVGFCVSCREKMNTFDPLVQALRLELILQKDLRAFRFGSGVN